MSATEMPAIPSKLRLIDGELVCEDGSSVREYLREFQRNASIAHDTPVVIMRRDTYAKVRQDALLLRCFAS